MEKIDYKKIFGEVFTPISLCEEMLNKLPEEVWGNPDLKWLDPACGSGNFLITVKQKLMKGLEKKIPDEIKREKHILNNMLYGVEIQPKNILLCLLRLDPNNKYSIKNHVVCENALEFDYWNDQKFDIVVGNPPYQKGRKTRGSQQASDFYPEFVDLSYKLSKRYIIMITPSRWFNKRGLDDFRFRMIHNYGIKYLWHTDDNKFFNGADIKGGVSYFLIDKEYIGDTYLNFIDDFINLKDNEDIFISRSILGLKIIEKLKKHDTLDKKCCPQSHFKIKTNDKRLHNNMNDNDIICYVSKAKGSNKYISINDVSKHNDVNKWKVILRAADGKGRDYSDFFIIGKPGEVCSESYICFLFDTKQQVDNFISYYNTNLFKYAMSIMKIKQHITKGVFSLVPDLNLNKKWDNDAVCQFIGLTKDEINYIDKMLQ